DGGRGSTDQQIAVSRDLRDDAGTMVDCEVPALDLRNEVPSARGVLQLELNHARGMHRRSRQLQLAEGGGRHRQNLALPFRVGERTSSRRSSPPNDPCPCATRTVRVSSSRGKAGRTTKGCSTIGSANVALSTAYIAVTSFTPAVPSGLTGERKRRRDTPRSIV